MANEAVLVDRMGTPVNFTVVDGTGIEKGALLKITDPRTAIISTAVNDSIAGIAHREKIASDGRTKLAVWRQGIFRMKLSGSCTVGDAVVSADTANHVNFVAAAGLAASGSEILGQFLETGTNGESVEIDLRIGTGGLRA